MTKYPFKGHPQYAIRPAGEFTPYKCYAARKYAFRPNPSDCVHDFDYNLVLPTFDSSLRGEINILSPKKTLFTAEL